MAAGAMGCLLRRCLVVLQFSCSSIIVGMLSFGQCQVRFEFSGRENSFVAEALSCWGDCQISADGTSAVLPRGVGGASGGVGRLMYHKPLLLYNSSAGTVASFSTLFVFTMVTDTNRSYVETADGFTFLIAPSPEVPPGSGGGALGLFNPKYPSGDPADGSTDLVAVEFDTFARDPNYWDPRPAYFPHVGLDLNSLNSSALSPRNNRVVEGLIGSTWGVWINYSTARQYLEVAVANITPGLPPDAWPWSTVLTYGSFNLSAFVQEESYVGFSASTGLGGQINTITYWTFQTSVDEVVLASAPAAPANPSAPAAPANPGGTGTEPSTTPAQPRHVQNTNVGLVTGLIVAISVILLSLFSCWRWRRRSGRVAPQASRGRSLPWPGTSSGDHFIQLPKAGYGPRSIEYNMLHKATKGFTTMLGEGGSGGVYLAVLADGTRLAVKKLKESSHDGEKQFLAEVSSIGQLSHKNLVPLRGWCQSHGELLLVYDYMPNGSLDNHLYGIGPASGSGAAAVIGLDWETGLNIIRGVAEALAYLHQGWKQPVIHRDIKPSNVMLDEEMNALLGDFGLAVFVDKHKLAQTVTRTAGTHGYLAPECLQTGKVGVESDLFSFGVLVLEVVCGRRPIDWCRPQNECLLLSWVWNLHIEDRLQEAVDTRFRGAPGAMEILLVGLMCSVPNPAARPKMSLVTQFLSGSIPVPRVPKEIPPATYQSILTPEAQNYMSMIHAWNNASSSTSLIKFSSTATSSTST